MEMKNIKYLPKFLGLAALTLVMFACEPQMDDDIDLGLSPNVEDIEYSVTFDESGTGVFEVTTPKVVGVWYFPTSDPTKFETKTGNRVSKSYSKRGTYNVSLGAYNKAGFAEGKKEISFEAPGAPLPDEAKSILDKTWMWDKETAGHIGNGPADATSAQWWVASPNEQDVKLYDDELIFHTDGSYTLNANGFVLCNEGAAHRFGVSATQSVLVPYTQPAGQEWYIAKEGDKMFLTFGGDGFPSYIPGDNWGSFKYEILELTETTLHIKIAFDWGAFFMRFKAQ
jgi:hypothetical protein